MLHYRVETRAIDTINHRGIHPPISMSDAKDEDDRKEKARSKRLNSAALTRAIKKMDRQAVMQIIAQEDIRMSQSNDRFTYMYTSMDFRYVALMKAFRYGNLEMVEFLVNSFGIYANKFPRRFVLQCVKHGHVDVFKWFIESRPHNHWYFSTAVDTALTYGQYKILEYVKQQILLPANHHIRPPIHSWKMLQWLKNNGITISQSSVKSFVDSAVKKKQVGIIWWLQKEGFTIPENGKLLCFVYNIVLRDLLKIVGDDVFGIIKMYLN